MTHIVYLALAISLMLGGLVFQSPAYAAVYKWVDEHGVSHYSGTPPSGKNYTVIKSKPTYPGQQSDKPKPAPKDADTTKQQQPRSKAANVSVSGVDKEKCDLIASEIEMLEGMDEVRLQTGDTTKLLTEEEKQSLIDERKKWHKTYCQ